MAKKTDKPDTEPQAEETTDQAAEDQAEGQADEQPEAAETPTAPPVAPQQVQVQVVGGQVYAGSPGTSSIAQMQEEIDQGVRASLMTCWLGMDAVQED